MDYRKPDESDSGIKREPIESNDDDIELADTFTSTAWPETHESPQVEARPYVASSSHSSEPQYPGNMTLTVDPSHYHQSTTWGQNPSLQSFNESHYSRHSPRYDTYQPMSLHSADPTAYSPEGYPPAATASPAMLVNDPEAAGMDYRVPLTETSPAMRVGHGSASSYLPVMAPASLPSIVNMVPNLPANYPAHGGSTHRPSPYGATSQVHPYHVSERQHPGRQNLPHFSTPTNIPQDVTLPPIKHNLERFEDMSPTEEFSRSSTSASYGPTSLSEPPSTHARSARHDPSYPSPPFGTTKMVRDIYNSLGVNVAAELSARMVMGVKPKHRGDYWFVYRRNYLNIENCSYKLSTSNAFTDGKLYLQRNINGVSDPIDHLSIGISARVGSDEGPVTPLKAFNKQRELQPGPHRQKMRPNVPSSANLYPFPTGENTHPRPRPSLFSFERIQFSKATQNNGSRRQHQQHFHFIVELYATHTAETGSHLHEVIATIASEKILVRGRSPSSFSEEEDDIINPRRQPRKVKDKDRRSKKVQARTRHAAAAAPANAQTIGSPAAAYVGRRSQVKTSNKSKSVSGISRSTFPSDSVSGPAFEDTESLWSSSLPALNSGRLDRDTASDLHWPSNLKDISEEAGGWMTSHDDANNRSIIDAVRSTRRGDGMAFAGSDLSQSTGVNTPSSRTSSFPPSDRYKRTVERSGASCTYELVRGPNAHPGHTTLNRESNFEDGLELADGDPLAEMGPGYLDELNPCFPDDLRSFL